MSPTTKHKNFFNEKLYCYSSSNVMHKIQHEHKIVKITSMGNNICFANELNEIYKIDSTEGTYQKLNPESTIKTSDNPPTNIPIKYLLAGYFHLIVILENNLIYGHGSADNGQLGSINSSHVDKLKLINTTNVFKTNNERSNKKERNKKENGQLEITHACCGTYSTVIVLNNKQIWYCGKFINDSKRNFSKLKIKYQKNIKIKNISAGYGHLLVLVKEHFSWLWTFISFS